MNVKLAAGRINLELLEVIASNLADPAEAEQATLAKEIIAQLLEPLMAFGAELCSLCGESPLDNNLLHTELLATHRHPAAPTEQLGVIELQSALARANQTIADRNTRIGQLTGTGTP